MIKFWMDMQLLGLVSVSRIAERVIVGVVSESGSESEMVIRLRFLWACIQSSVSVESESEGLYPCLPLMESEAESNRLRFLADLGFVHPFAFDLLRRRFFSVSRCPFSS